MPKYPEIKVTLSDGNAFTILSKVSQALTDAGVSESERQAFLNEATGSDYYQTLRAAVSWVTVDLPDPDTTDRDPDPEPPYTPEPLPDPDSPVPFSQWWRIIVGFLRWKISFGSLILFVVIVSIFAEVTIRDCP